MCDSSFKIAISASRSVELRYRIPFLCRRVLNDIAEAAFSSMIKCIYELFSKMEGERLNAMNIAVF